MLRKPSYAYIDAGTASMLFQLLVGGILAALLSIKIYWRRLLALLHVHRKDKPKS